MYLRHSLESRLALNLRSSCLSLQCVGITGVSHHTILSILEYVKSYTAHSFFFPNFSDLSIATKTYSTHILCVFEAAAILLASEPVWSSHTFLYTQGTKLLISFLNLIPTVQRISVLWCIP